MKTNLLLFFSVFIYQLLPGQSFDERIAPARTPVSDVELITMPYLDNEALLEAEMERRGPGIAPRFAENIEVDINPSTNGTWETLDNGSEVWRLRILSAEAHSINLGFSEYYMPQGGTLILYSPDKKRVMGPFTPSDNEVHDQLWTPIFEGDQLVIEVQLPAGMREELRLRLSYVNHDFIGFSNIVAMSGSCNLDVVCGEADGWGIVDRYRDIIQSVAVIGLGGGTFCTGFLINNARNDCTPYFMTAAHCGINNNNAASLVAYWNYQNSFCRQPNTPQSGGAGNGTLNDFNTGAFFRSAYSPSDFSLVEFDDPVSETANAFFAGWVVDSIPPQDTVICVHHPSTDEKRISFEFQPTYLGNWGSGDTPVPNGNHVIVPDWDIGTTEGGSSGSPLFDRLGRVVGQLHGGSAACNNDLYDSYGWFTSSWEGGGTPQTRLKDWLDPDNLGITSLDGRWAMACSFSVAPTLAAQAVCAPDSAVYHLAVSENFVDSVFIDLADIPDGAEVTLSANPAMPGDTVQLTISNTGVLESGVYVIIINGTDSVETSVAQLTLTVYAGIPSSVELATPADGEDGVTIFPVFNWSGLPDALTYEFQIASDPDFTDIVGQVADLAATSVSGAMLESQTTYYWRVRAGNICGNGDWSDVFAFTTAAVICAAQPSTDVPVTISSSGTPTITSSIEINTPGGIVEVRVLNLDISHTWVGDLSARLISPLGTEITLFDRPGVPSDFFGCDGDNLLLNLFDGAPSSAEDLENSCGNLPAISGSFQPVLSLANLAGEPATGTWTLSITDHVNQDGGVLNGWQLDVCAALPNDLSITPLGGEFRFCNGEDFSFDILLGTAFDEAGVQLSVEGLPGGAEAVFSDNPAAPGTIVTVTVSGIVDPGEYAVVIYGNDGTDEGDVEVTLYVEGPPADVNLLTPVDMADNVPLSATLTWEADPAADSYTIWVSTDPDFTDLIVNVTQTGASYNVAGLEFATTYYWRVVAENQCGQSGEGDVFSFTTVPDLSFTVSPQSVEVCPSEDAVFSLSVGPGFSVPLGMSVSSEPSVDFTVTASADPGNIPPGSVVIVTIGGLAIVPAGTYNLTFTLNDGEHVVNATATLIIDSAPAVPALLSPANSAVLTDQTPTLSWSSVADADEYVVEISTNDIFTQIVEQATLTATEYTVGEPLAGGLYFWRVSAENECGGSTSAPRGFTIQPSSTGEINGRLVRFDPNPTSGLFNIRFSEPLSGDLRIEVFSIDGRQLQRLEIGNAPMTAQVDLSGYSSGVYLVRLVNERASLTQQVILQK
jgi:subtilisin-like proprotein convertase family protein